MFHLNLLYKRVFGTLLLAGGLLAASRGQAQTVLNGSFEAPELNYGYTTGSGTNWKTTGQVYLFTNEVDYGLTPYGNQWSIVYSGATVSQQLSGAFTPNTAYTLSVSSADVYGYQGDQLAITISGGGLKTPVTKTFAIPQNTEALIEFGGDLPLEAYQVAFTPLTSAPVTVTFANVSKSSGVVALDNVVLTHAKK